MNVFFLAKGLGMMRVPLDGTDSPPSHHVRPTPARAASTASAPHNRRSPPGVGVPGSRGQVRRRPGFGGVRGSSRRDQPVTAHCERHQMSDLKATLKTNRGDIVVDLFPNHAPKTVDNFVGLAEGSKDYTDDAGRSGVPYYDGLVFHRVINGFMIQGGCPLRRGSRRTRLHLRRRDPPRAALRQALPARDGERRPGHQRIAVLHHRRPDARGSTASTPSSARSPTRPRATSSTRSPRPRSGPATARATRSSSSPSRSTGPDAHGAAR